MAETAFDAEKFSTGMRFFNAAACCASTDYSHITRDTLDAGLYYGESQVWLGYHGKRVLRGLQSERDARSQ